MPVTEFPCLLYKTPGPHRKPGGLTYAYVGCADAQDYERLVAQGWRVSLSDALAGKGVISAAEAFEDAVDNVSPATRDELEQKAKELGVSFNSRTSNETLAKRIAEAID